ncbi:MAG TPA: hypothetical protein VGC36_05925 [Rhizomicrobium sp.]
MDEQPKNGQRLGLVAMALASVAAPLVIQDAAAAASGTSPGNITAPQTGSRNTIVLGADGKAHSQMILLGADGKPQNNRFVIGRDGKYHEAPVAPGTGSAIPGGNNHTSYRRSEEP